VVEALKRDTARPAEWCKTIPVEINLGVELDDASLDFLRREFKEVIGAGD
jgi:hypothetical protein